METWSSKLNSHIIDKCIIKIVSPLGKSKIQRIKNIKLVIELNV